MRLRANIIGWPHLSRASTVVCVTYKLVQLMTLHDILRFCEHPGGFLQGAFGFLLECVSFIINKFRLAESFFMQKKLLRTHTQSHGMTSKVMGFRIAFQSRRSQATTRAPSVRWVDWGRSPTQCTNQKALGAVRPAPGQCVEKPQTEPIQCGAPRIAKLIYNYNN